MRWLIVGVAVAGALVAAVRPLEHAVFCGVVPAGQFPAAVVPPPGPVAP